jgi:hypothetical protein
MTDFEFDEQRLYEDSDFRVSTGKKLRENSFYIKHKGEEYYHIIPIIKAREIAKAPRGNLEELFDNVDPEIRSSLKRANLNIDSAHLAISLAYIYVVNTPHDPW